jgi:hypothetical protein
MEDVELDLSYFLASDIFETLFFNKDFEVGRLFEQFMELCRCDGKISATTPTPVI